MQPNPSKTRNEKAPATFDRSGANTKTSKASVSGNIRSTLYVVKRGFIMGSMYTLI